MTEVSIIIVNFNTKEFILNCLKSIIASKPKVSYEIIVVDNGSSDGSTEAVEEKYSEVVLIKNRKNLGFAKANNQGISRARGEHILFLNSDTKVKKGSLDKLIKFAKQEKEGVIGARLLNSDGSLQPSCFNFPTIINAIKEYWLGQKRTSEKYAPAGKEPVEVDAVVGAAFLITPEALQKVGLLDERYFMFFEDLDYCRRIWKKSLKVYYLPEAEVIHYHGISGKEFAAEEDQWRRLIMSSKIYHGFVKHYLINFVIWSGQKLGKIFRKH